MASGLRSKAGRDAKAAQLEGYSKSYTKDDRITSDYGVRLLKSSDWQRKLIMCV